MWHRPRPNGVVADPLINIYAQDHEHSPVLIVGNTEGLLAVRTAIDAALHEGHGAPGISLVYGSDGAGYLVAAMRRAKPGSWWRRLMRPFSVGRGESRTGECINPIKEMSDADSESVYRRVRSRLDLGGK